MINVLAERLEAILLSVDEGTRLLRYLFLLKLQAVYAFSILSFSTQCLQLLLVAQRHVWSLVFALLYFLYVCAAEKLVLKHLLSIVLRS